MTRKQYQKAVLEIINNKYDDLEAEMSDQLSRRYYTPDAILNELDTVGDIRDAIKNIENE